MRRHTLHQAPSGGSRAAAGGRRIYTKKVTVASYEGRVLLLHGTKDSIVPMWCSEQYPETYGDRATLVKVDGENHLITRSKKEILSSTVAFFREVLGK